MELALAMANGEPRQCYLYVYDIFCELLYCGIHVWHTSILCTPVDFKHTTCAPPQWLSLCPLWCICHHGHMPGTLPSAAPRLSVFYLGGSVEFPNLTFSPELAEPSSPQFHAQTQALSHYVSVHYCNRSQPLYVGVWVCILYV